MVGPLGWLDRKSLPAQLSVLSLVLAPPGALMGYLLHEPLAVGPVQGALMGVIVAVVPLIAWITRQANKMK